MGWLLGWAGCITQYRNQKRKETRDWMPQVGSGRTVPGFLCEDVCTVGLWFVPWPFRTAILWHPRQHSTAMQNIHHGNPPWHDCFFRQHCHRYFHTFSKSRHLHKYLCHNKTTSLHKFFQAHPWHAYLYFCVASSKVTSKCHIYLSNNAFCLYYRNVKSRTNQFWDKDNGWNWPGYWEI